MGILDRKIVTKMSLNMIKLKYECQHDISEMQAEPTWKLCENMDCERCPSEGQWGKCNLCDGYYNEDGLGDILFIEEAPNNKRAQCELCGKDTNIVQMKETGQFICEHACDEDESSP